jgi:plastocyanin
MKRLAVVIGAALLLSCVANSNAQTAKLPHHEDGTKTVTMWDACDPDTFNAVVGAGACIPGNHGKTLFGDFIAELQADQIAGAWRFNPLVDASAGTFKLAGLELEPGDHISIVNKGGEQHTFTRVKKYDGGFIAGLNGLSGNPTPAPECAQVLPDGSLAPKPESDTNQFVEAGLTEAGPTAGTSALPAGVSRWECCIHPWMRLTIVVKEHEHGHEHEREH